MSEPALRLTNVARRYRQGQGTLEVFRNVQLTLDPGELVALVGPSGAGKSSLLHMAGLLEAPSEGEIYIDGAAASQLPDRERTRLRRERIGFVYQAHHLLPEFSALENVVVPQRIAGRPGHEAQAEAERLLALVGLSERLEHRPSQLSGGEQQRVAIARAMANSPRLLLADEPTGNLDSATGEEVMQLLTELNGEGTTVIMVTHSRPHAEYAHRIVNLLDGAVVTEKVRMAV